MAMMWRKDAERMPDSPGKARLLAALDFSDAEYAKQEKKRIEALPDLRIRDPKAEKHLQSVCEGLLTARGYRRMTAEEAVRSRQPEAFTAGWYSHLHKPVGNPLHPDLLIFDPKMERCLAVELKTRNVYQPGQSEMIQSGAWVVCFSFEEFIVVLDEWGKK